MPGLNSRKTIRASEIGAYLYCRRAWWYRLQGYPSQNQDALDQGTRFHLGHGRRVGSLHLLRLTALLLSLAALGLLAAAVLFQLLG